MTMRRHLRAVVAVTSLCAALLVLMSIFIIQGKDRVLVTETALEGDPKAAEGLTVTTRLEYENCLFWQTDYRMGQVPSYDTEFTFLQLEADYSYWTEFSGLQIYDAINSSGWGSLMDDLERENPMGMEKAFLELYELAKLEEPGEEVKKQIYVKDYYDYYPVDFTWDFPTVRKDNGSYMLLTPREDTQAYKEAAAVYGEFFRIPVLEKEALELHMVLRGDGYQISNYGHSGAYSEDPEKFDSFYFYTTAQVLTDSACYFTIENRSNGGAYMDTSLIPGGFGIYCQPYTVGEDGKSIIDPKTLYTAYTLEETVSVYDMQLSPDGKDILLFTAEDGQLWLTVIDTATMENRQRIMLCEENGYQLYATKDHFMVVTVGWNRMIVLERQADGTYTVPFTVEMPEGYQLYGSGYAGNPDFCFDGERLAVADHLMEMDEDSGYWHGTKLDHYVAVFTAQGLQYYGEFTNSFSPAIPYDQSSVYIDTLEIDWE